MPKSPEQLKQLSIKEFTEAAQVYELSLIHISVYPGQAGSATTTRGNPLVYRIAPAAPTGPGAPTSGAIARSYLSCKCVAALTMRMAGGPTSIGKLQKHGGSSNPDGSESD